MRDLTLEWLQGVHVASDGQGLNHGALPNSVAMQFVINLAKSEWLSQRFDLIMLCCANVAQHYVLAFAV